MAQAIAENLQIIQQRIKAACRKTGRSPASVQLIAVSKQQPVSAIGEAIAAGQRVFGENRVQEALQKWQGVKARTPGVELHLIGPLQTNKVADALKVFDVIETVDRPKLAGILAKEKALRETFPQCFIQVNIGEEPQKSGISSQECEAFIGYCLHDLALPITGLMAIPPASEPPAPYFSKLATLAGRHGLPHLSMGMSGDFEAAITCGATHIRVGEAIFGAR